MTETKKSGDIAVTKNMLDETRNELKSDNASLRLEMKAGFQKLGSQFEEVKSEIKQLTSEVKDQNAKIHRMLTLYEEQDTRNKYVLDGYQSLRDLREKDKAEFDERLSNIEKTISGPISN